MPILRGTCDQAVRLHATRRAAVLPMAAIAVLALIAGTCPMPRILVWNASSSLPVGLYYLHETSVLRIGDRVAIDPPPKLRHLLTVRGYLAPGLPLLKQVAALPGDSVCRSGRTIAVNGNDLGEARLSDRRARPLPAWQDCHVLASDEIFVMNPRSPDSFDGRYFGPIARDRLLGRAIPLWTDETGEGRYAWFADPLPLPLQNHHEGDTQ